MSETFDYQFVEAVKQDLIERGVAESEIEDLTEKMIKAMKFNKAYKIHTKFDFACWTLIGLCTSLFFFVKNETVLGYAGIILISSIAYMVFSNIRLSWENERLRNINATLRKFNVLLGDTNGKENKTIL